MTTNQWTTAVPARRPHPAATDLPPSAAEDEKSTLVAAHGGCGATTLAQHQTMTGLVRELALPRALRADEATTSPWVLVAAATTDGTAAAVRALHRIELAGAESSRVHLVVVRDGRGPLPVAARARLRLLSPVVAGIDVLPHVQRWRYEANDFRTPSPRYDRAVDRIAAHLGQRFWSTDARGSSPTRPLLEDS